MDQNLGFFDGFASEQPGGPRGAGGLPIHLLHMSQQVQELCCCSLVKAWAGRSDGFGAIDALN